MKKYIVILLVSLIFLFDLQAGNKVKLVSRPCLQDSILLRWAPADKETWTLGNRYGYVLERYTLLREGQLLQDKEHVVLTPSPQKPLPLEAWEPYEEDRYVSVAAQCIFGESEPLPMLSPSAIARKYREERNRFSMALFAADQSVLTARLSGLYWVDKTVIDNEKYLYTIHIATPDSIPSDTAFVFTGLSEYRPLPKPLELTAHWEDRKVLLSWNILYLNPIYNSYIVEKSTDGKHYTAISENAMVQAADEGIVPEYAYRSDSLPDNHTVWYYRVKGVNAFGETGPPCDSVVGRGRIPITSIPVVINKEVIDNKAVRLQWSYAEEMNEYITGFRVYRSGQPTGPKEKIFETKRTSDREFIDKQPDITNYYVLSVFDDEKEKVSPVHTYAELIDNIPPHKPAGLKGNIDSLGIVGLTWKRNADRDINGYRIFRSDHPEFEFLLISPAMVTDTFFVDSIHLNTLNKTIYYRLCAEDLRLNRSDFSDILELKRPDRIPPVAPVIQKADERKNGLQITWYNSSSDDVVRHHIYRKTENDTVFRYLADAGKPSGKQSVYTDNSIQAGETYIYQVQAEDESGLYSPFSAPFLKKAPGGQVENIVLKKQEIADKVILNWTIQSRKRVEKILIYKAINDAPIQLSDHSTGDNYTDTDIVVGKIYRYRIKAVYEDGSSSGLSNEITLKI
jgi:fibronectin type 3 domain-containing protein